MYIRAALGVLGIIVVLATKDTLKKDILKKNPTANQAKLDDLFNSALTVGIVVGVVFLVLYVLLAMQVAKGKNWARIVTLVLAGLGVLSLISSFVATAPALSHVVSIVSGLIDLGIFVLLLTGGSGTYFRKTA
jgi:heme/copper-type cytochrome/quinol oxidase subunit 2